MSRPAQKLLRNRISPVSWFGAVAVHAVILGLLLQFGAEPARSNISPRPDVEAVRVQAADEKQLQQRREAHRQALREEKLRKEAERKREQEARRKAEQEKKKAAALAEVKRKAKEEAKRKREREARQKAEEAKKKAAAQAEAERKAREEARKLKEAEARAQTRREEQVRRRQREAAHRARQANIWRIAIKSRIERVWLQPPAVRTAPCEVVVEQNEKGEVLSAKVQGCRASRTWQESLRNAVLKASPLPRPPDPELFDRLLVITFHPKASN